MASRIGPSTPCKRRAIEPSVYPPNPNTAAHVTPPSAFATKKARHSIRFTPAKNAVSMRKRATNRPKNTADQKLQKLAGAGNQSWDALNAALAETRGVFDRANQSVRDAFKKAAA